MPYCSECGRLVAEYARRERAYLQAAGTLKKLETSAVVPFMASRLLADEARLDAELAKRELERHMREHSDKRSVAGRDGSEN